MIIQVQISDSVDGCEAQPASSARTRTDDVVENMPCELWPAQPCEKNSERYNRSTAAFQQPLVASTISGIFRWFTKPTNVIAVPSDAVAGREATMDYLRLWLSVLGAAQDRLSPEEEKRTRSQVELVLGTVQHTQEPASDAHAPRFAAYVPPLCALVHVSRDILTCFCLHRFDCSAPILDLLGNILNCSNMTQICITGGFPAELDSAHSELLAQFLCLPRLQRLCWRVGAQHAATYFDHAIAAMLAGHVSPQLSTLEVFHMETDEWNALVLSDAQRANYVAFWRACPAYVQSIFLSEYLDKLDLVLQALCDSAIAFLGTLTVNLLCTPRPPPVGSGLRQMWSPPPLTSLPAVMTTAAFQLLFSLRARDVYLLHEPTGVRSQYLKYLLPVERQKSLEVQSCLSRFSFCAPSISVIGRQQRAFITPQAVAEHVGLYISAVSAANTYDAARMPDIYTLVYNRPAIPSLSDVIIEMQDQRVSMRTENYASRAQNIVHEELNEMRTFVRDQKAYNETVRRAAAVAEANKAAAALPTSSAKAIKYDAPPPASTDDATANAPAPASVPVLATVDASLRGAHPPTPPKHVHRNQQWREISPHISLLALLHLVTEAIETQSDDEPGSYEVEQADMVGYALSLVYLMITHLRRQVSRCGSTDRDHLRSELSTAAWRLPVYRIIGSLMRRKNIAYDAHHFHALVYSANADDNEPATTVQQNTLEVQMSDGVVITLERDEFMAMRTLRLMMSAADNADVAGIPLAYSAESMGVLRRGMAADKKLFALESFRATSFQRVCTHVFTRKVGGAGGSRRKRKNDGSESTRASASTAAVAAGAAASADNIALFVEVLALAGFVGCEVPLSVIFVACGWLLDAPLTIMHPLGAVHAAGIKTAVCINASASASAVGAGGIPKAQDAPARALPPGPVLVPALVDDESAASDADV